MNYIKIVFKNRVIRFVPEGDLATQTRYRNMGGEPDKLSNGNLKRYTDTEVRKSYRGKTVQSPEDIFR